MSEVPNIRTYSCKECACKSEVEELFRAHTKEGHVKTNKNDSAEKRLLAETENEFMGECFICGECASNFQSMDDVVKHMVKHQTKRCKIRKIKSNI